MLSDYEKLKELYEQIDELQSIDVYDDKFANSLIVWNAACMAFFNGTYGNDSPEYANYRNIIAFTDDEPSNDIYKKRLTIQQKRLPVIKSIFSNLLDDLKEDKAMVNGDKNNVFIVHGHNDNLLDKISNLLLKVGIHPIILKNEIDNGMTIIEKLEEYSKMAKIAIILFTSDDIGRMKIDDEDEDEERARQNVVFEAGYFMALLGRKNTLVVKSGNVKLPGDIQGIVYTDENDKNKLMKELYYKLQNNGFDIKSDIFFT